MAQEVLFKWSSVENKQTKKIRIRVKKKDTLVTKKEQTPPTHTHTHTHSLTQSQCKLQNQGIVFLQKWFNYLKILHLTGPTIFSTKQNNQISIMKVRYRGRENKGSRQSEREREGR